MKTTLEMKIKRQQKCLIEQYEESPNLAFLQNRPMNYFDMSTMPQVIQDMVKLAVSKSSGFSNIAALATTNFVLSHLFGQTRIRITDPIFSDDDIGPNTYSMILARSGQGKDSTYQALMKAILKGMEYIEEMQKEEFEEAAKLKYIKQMSKDNPDFDAATVLLEDFEDLVQKSETLITSLNSSRGGLTSSLNRMAKSSFGAKSLFSSELGMAVQSNKGILEVLELYSTLFDMGASVAPEYKTDDAKEEDVVNAFVSLLGISSPTPFYNKEGNVNKLLIPLMKTSLARRTTIIFSLASEELENKVVALSPSEKRQIKAENRLILKEYTERLGNELLEATKGAIADTSMIFDEEASVIYDDYKSYLEEVSDLLLSEDPESVIGIEMSGRAFKMGRIAACWSLAQNTRVINKDTLISAIYFCDYASTHLERFNQTLSMADYERFLNDWKHGFFTNNRLPLHKAIMKGYISERQLNSQSLANFLKPVNSTLTGEATVSYNESTDEFVFTPVVKISPADSYAYRATKGHVTEKPIVVTQEGKSMEVLGKLLSVQSSFNPFNEETTKFVTLNVDNSFLSLEQISKYLSKVHHFIAPKDDPDNKHSFAIIIPVSNVINKAEYKFVSLSIANQLMLKLLPEEHEAESIYYGHANSTVLVASSGATLFDCSGILANYASGGSAPILTGKPAIKPTKAAIDKYVNTLMDNKQSIVEAIDASSTQLLIFAGLVHDMYCNSVSTERIADIVDNINSSLVESVTESIKQTYLLDPFNSLGK